MSATTLPWAESPNSREPRVSNASAADTNSGARLQAINAARNPLLEAGRPLLRALADMPRQLDTDAIDPLRRLLQQEVRLFQKLCEQANLRRDHMLGARYSLCTALDEVVMLALDATNVSAWADAPLASIFHEDNQGGQKVYLLIGRLMTEPREHLNLLEVIYRVLSLGFEGMYRAAPSGHRQHDEIRQRLYTEIVAQRGPVPAALSPHWTGATSGRSRSFFDIPVWVTASVLGLILLAMFCYAKYDLMTHGAAVQKEIADIGRMTPPAPSALHLRELLSMEIAAGKVSVDEDARHSAVTFHGDDMFVPGKAMVNASMQPLVARIAAEIIKVPGKVTVIGHTDNMRVRGGAFASNQALSEERAAQVMQMLQDAGVPASRLEALGKGDTSPIADNRTLPGRAQNRRVEINVAE
jgi:type VI secretion system protein ImpK